MKNEWSLEELALLEAIYVTASLEEIVRAFPRHTYSEVQWKAGELGLEDIKRSYRQQGMARMTGLQALMREREE